MYLRFLEGGVKHLGWKRHRILNDCGQRVQCWILGCQLKIYSRRVSKFAVANTNYTRLGIMRSQNNRNACAYRHIVTNISGCNREIPTELSKLAPRPAGQDIHYQQTTTLGYRPGGGGLSTRYRHRRCEITLNPISADRIRMWWYQSRHAEACVNHAGK